MARLHEYQGKAILAANGFKIPRGRAASTADDAVVAARDLVADTKGGTVVIKIQAWTTGRDPVKHGYDAPPPPKCNEIIATPKLQGAAVCNRRPNKTAIANRRSLRLAQQPG